MVVPAHAEIATARVGTGDPIQLGETGSVTPAIYAMTHALGSGWKASYGLGLAEHAALAAAFAHFDETFADDALSPRRWQDNWRHYLGLEFEPVDGLTLLAGILKAGTISGTKGSALAPTGYERLRLNTGARWRNEDWGLDGSFCFIPSGAERMPADAGVLPGTGDSGPTWLFSLTLSRRF